jgi:hypothetical protein
MFIKKSFLIIFIIFSFLCICNLQVENLLKKNQYFSNSINQNSKIHYLKKIIGNLKETNLEEEYNKDEIINQNLILINEDLNQTGARINIFDYLENQIKLIEEENKEIQIKKEKIENLINENKILKQKNQEKISTNEGEIEKINQLIDRLGKAIEKLNSDKNQFLKPKINNLRNEGITDQLKNEIINLEKEEKIEEEKLNGLNKIKNDLLQKIKTLNNENEEKIAQLESNIREKEEEFLNLKEELNNLTLSNKPVKDQKEEIEKIQKEKTEFEDKSKILINQNRENLKNIMNSLIKENEIIKKLAQDKKKLSKKINEKKKILEELKEKEFNLELGNLKIINDSNKEFNSLESEIFKKDNELNKLKIEKSNLERKNKILINSRNNGNLIHEKNKLNDLEIKNKNKNKNAKILFLEVNKMNKNLEITKYKLQSQTNAKIFDLKNSQIEKLKEEIYQKNNQINSLNDEIKNYKRNTKINNRDLNNNQKNFQE